MSSNFVDRFAVAGQRGMPELLNQHHHLLGIFAGGLLKQLPSLFQQRSVYLVSRLEHMLPRFACSDARTIAAAAFVDTAR